MSTESGQRRASSAVGAPSDARDRIQAHRHAQNEFVPSPCKHSPHPLSRPSKSVPSTHKTLNFSLEKRPLRGSLPAQPLLVCSLLKRCMKSCCICCMKRHRSRSHCPAVWLPYSSHTAYTHTPHTSYITIHPPSGKIVTSQNDAHVSSPSSSWCFRSRAS